MFFNILFLLKISLVLLFLGIFSKDAYSATLEEVVVTAQKREQSLQDASVAVTALSESRIWNP